MQFHIATFTISNTIAVNETGLMQVQSFPNPFSDKTTIRFTLEQSSELSFTLYDLVGVGKQVITNQFFNIGTHEVSFTKDNLKSGVYFLQIDTDNMSALVENSSEIVRLIIK